MAEARRSWRSEQKCRTVLDASASWGEARERASVLVVAGRPSAKPLARPSHRHVAKLRAASLRRDTHDVLEAHSRREDRKLSREPCPRGSRVRAQGRGWFRRNPKPRRPELVKDGA